MLRTRWRRALSALGTRRAGAIRYAGAGSKPFDPLDLAHHAYYIGDAYNATTGQWDDGSGNNNHATPASTGKPSSVTRWGQAVVQTTATSQELTVTYHATLTQPYTVYAVFEVADFASNRTICDSDTLAARGLVNTLLTSGNMRLYNGSSFNTGLGASVNVPQAFIAVIDGANTTAWLNDWSGSGVVGDPGSHNPVDLTIFADTAGGTDLLGYIGHLGFIPGRIADADRARLGQYLDARYSGLTVTT